jgi:hypothetical protein
MRPRALLLFADLPPEWRDPSLRPPWVKPALGAGLAVLVVLLLLLLVWRLFGGRSRRPDQETPETDESGLIEDLASFPPPPPRPEGSLHLSVRGVPVRVRLVVLAPLGRGAVIQPDHAVDFLDQVVNGLSTLTRQDQARVRLWPAQLSGHGFHPMFLRLARRTEALHEPSPWVLVAGQARIGARHVLVGLALQARNPVILEGLNPEPDDWYTLLRVEQRS